MKISFAAPSLPRSGALVVGVLSGGHMLATAQRVDKASDGALARSIGASRFKGESGQSLTVMAPAGVGADRVVLVGLGEAGKFDDLAAQALGFKTAFVPRPLEYGPDRVLDTTADPRFDVNATDFMDLAAQM